MPRPQQMEILSKGEFHTSSSGLHDSYLVADDLVAKIGEVIVIFGDSGVGKSVLARELVDALRQQHTQNCEFAPIVSYLPQDSFLFAESSIKSNVDILCGAGNFELVKNACPKSLREIVEQFSEFGPGILSGGERRLFMLMCVWHQRSDLVILDESLVSFDERALHFTLNFVKTQALVAARSIVIISHDPRVIGIADHCYLVEKQNGKRTVRRHVPNMVAQAFRCDSNILALRYDEEPVSRVVRTHSKWTSLLANFIGLCAAMIAVMLLLLSPKVFGSESAKKFLPDFSAVCDAFARNTSSILREGFYSLACSLGVLLVSVLVSLIFWLIILLFRPTHRKWLFSVWIALQGIPVLVFAPFLQLCLRLDNRLFLVCATALFICVFPLGVVGARIIASTPHDIWRTVRSERALRRFGIAIVWNKGAILRAIVACSPLAGIGVVVAEYIVGDRGVGQLMFRIMSGAIADRYVWGVVCSLIAGVLYILTTIFAVMRLPKGCSLD